MLTEKLLILDFGSQYTQLIARRVREQNVFSEIKPCFVSPNECDLKQIKAIILSGGPSSVITNDKPEFNSEWLNLGLPILGVCYGMQLLASLLGGDVQSSKKREYGHADLIVKNNNSLFSGFDIDSKNTVWMSHGDHVEKLPQGFEPLAVSNDIPYAGMGNEESKIYGIQFHPEVVHTKRGQDIINNFIFKIAGFTANWNSHNFIETVTNEIQSLVDKDVNVICGLSGGVDSSVAAVLIDRAIHSALKCIFVDTGLSRKNEASQVYEMLGPSGLGLDLIIVDAKDKFLGELKGVTDPEKKRKIIGKVFIEVFEEEAKKIPNVQFLVQGTLYPDIIESVSVRGPSATIKSHHNVGGLPEKMNLKLLEPFKELFKDEVRKIGAELGIPREIINRQPFPGPGLAVRILGEVTEERLNLLKEADSIIDQEIRSAGLYESIWQSFAVLLPINSVGVMGDSRTYEQCIALRAVHSDDGMTADWCYLPQEVLRKISNRIINEVKGINRVVLDISSKPPATIEWE